MGIPNLTEKLKSVKQSAVPDHLPQCNCSIDFDYFDILASDTNKFNVENYKFNIGYLVDQPEELVASFCLEHTNII